MTSAHRKGPGPVKAQGVIEPERRLTQVEPVRLEGRCVLLVDDDDAQREVLAEVLELEGVRVLAASTAAEAVRLLGQNPDVVLMDLHGVEVEPVRVALSSHPQRPSLLIVSGDLRLAQHAQSLGADGWLAKPYELDQLLGVVSDALDRREASLAP